MDITIDISHLINFFSLPAPEMAKVFFLNIGWMVFAWYIVQGILQIYLSYIRKHWAADNARYLLLAIDIPRGNEQSPKAVENIFAYLGGAHGSVNFFEKWFDGKFQLSFSFEIVSLEGYTQFLIRTPVEWRNLVETAVYSQYPDAEISEVDDYVNTVPHRFPDEEYDIWGTEFIQTDPFPYPIKLYMEFEHDLGDSEKRFRDPMSTLMDLCGSIGPGEQLWYQIIVIPTDFSWAKKGDEAVNKILGKKVTKAGKFSKFISGFGDIIEGILGLKTVVDPKAKPKDEGKGLSMIELNPKQKKQLEAIYTKTSKMGFQFKIRAVYVARKEAMNRGKVSSGLVGYMKQFIALDLNSFKPDLKRTMTKVSYFHKDPRLARKKNKLMSNYIAREDWAGRAPGILNNEELATIWHFPVESSSRSSMLQKSPGRKGEAPSSLPVLTEETSSPQPEDRFSVDIAGVSPDAVPVEDNKLNKYLGQVSSHDAGPPPNLPTL